MVSISSPAVLTPPAKKALLIGAAAAATAAAVVLVYFLYKNQSKKKWARGIDQYCKVLYSATQINLSIPGYFWHLWMQK